jgi:hypothetical protein
LADVIPRNGTFIVQAVLPSLFETRSKSCPLAPPCFHGFIATMGKSDSRSGPFGELCIPHHRLDSGHLLPCPSHRVSQVPWFSLCNMPPPNTPNGKTRRSCFLIATLPGFPIRLEGRHRHSCNEAESSSLTLRPATYLTFRPFPTLLDASNYSYTPGRRLRGEQAITAGGISTTRITRASPGAQSFNARG